jgi:hypothetical protein
MVTWESMMSIEEDSQQEAREESAPDFPVRPSTTRELPYWAMSAIVCLLVVSQMSLVDVPVDPVPMLRP